MVILLVAALIGILCFATYVALKRFRHYARMRDGEGDRTTVGSGDGVIMSSLEDVPAIDVVAQEIDLPTDNDDLF